MGSQSELEIGVLLGETYWKLFKLIVNEISKNAYLVIPHVMKLSMHPPNPPEFPDVHVHWKDFELGIHEDIDPSFFSSEFQKELAIDLLNRFSYYPQNSGEDVIVLPTGFISDACRTETVGSRERMVVDTGRLVETMWRGTFYSTKARMLPLLVTEIMRNNPYLNLHKDLSILGISQDRIIMPIDQDLMLGFEHRELMDNLTRTGFGALVNPMQRAIEIVSRRNPSAIQKWIPQERIEGFAQETMNSLKQIEPKIVNF